MRAMHGDLPRCGGSKMGTASAVRDSLGGLSRTAERLSGPARSGWKTQGKGELPIRYDECGLQTGIVTERDVAVRLGWSHRQQPPT